MKTVRYLSKGMFTPSDYVTVTVTLTGGTCLARSKAPPVNVAVTVTESLGVNEP